MPRKKSETNKKKSKNKTKINENRLLSLTELKNEPYKSFFDKLRRFLDVEIAFEPRSTVVVAVSGGSDSIAALDAFANVSLFYPETKLIAASFNHKLRGEAAEKDVELVKKAAKKYGIPFETDSADVKEFARKKGTSVENAARILRYQFLQKTAKKFDAEYVVTAHTLDDSVETFFLNLFRGAGVSGLAGIPPKRQLAPQIFVVRPFLRFKKSELIEYAKLRKLKWREDETNSLLDYARNRVRHRLLPFIEKEFTDAALKNVWKTQTILRGADNFIEEKYKAAIQKITAQRRKNAYALNLTMLASYDKFFQGEIIKRSLASNFGFNAITINAVDRILDLANSTPGSIYEIDKRLLALRDRNAIIFSKKAAVAPVRLELQKEGEYKFAEGRLVLKRATKRQLKIGQDPNVEFFDYDKIPSRLILRRWEAGDSFKPLGMEGTMKVSDFLVNRKIPLIDKAKVLVLATVSDIIWVCGMMISDNYKIDETTSKYLRAEIIWNNEKNEDKDK